MSARRGIVVAAMSYRDDHEAAQAKIDALARRVDELERENASLHHLRTTNPTLLRRERIFRRAAWLFVAAVALLAAGAALSRVARAPWDAALPLAGAVGLLLMLGAWATFVVAARVVAGPREALMIAGGARGMRALRPGEGAVVIPLLFRVEPLSLEPVSVTAPLRDVRTREGDAATLTLRATLEWQTQTEALVRAAGFALNVPRERVEALVVTVFEREVRGVVSCCRREMLDRDHERVCEEVERSTHDAMERYGLRVATLSYSVEPADR